MKVLPAPYFKALATRIKCSAIDLIGNALDGLRFEHTLLLALESIENEHP
jgi:hypothetical protein